MSRIGELLVREKMLSLQQLQQAQDEAKRTGKRLGATLSRLGYVKDQELTQFVAQAVLAAVDQPRRDRDRRGRAQARAARDLREASGHPGSPQRPDADRRDGGPVEHLRDRRAEVPHPVQHRAGRRERGRARGRAVALLRQGPRPRPDDGRVRLDNVDYASVERRCASTSSISRTRPARRRSSSCATRSCCRRSRRRRRISTSSRTRRASACGSASTASSRRRCGRRSSCATRSRAASRSWRRSTSPSAGSRRTVASS